MIIKSGAESVKVLKAIDMPNLRIFPGPNTIDDEIGENIEKYFENNVAAKAIKKKHLTIVGEETLSPDDKAIADAAKKKNDELNKASKVLKATNAKLVKSDATIAKQAEQLEAQEKQLHDQSVQISDQAEQMKKLVEQMNSLTAKSEKTKTK